MLKKYAQANPAGPSQVEEYFLQEIKFTAE